MWVGGKVERQKNLVILYPVETRDAKTLESIIRKHVVPGTEVYIDGWEVYDNLNRLGYNHFSVPHKHQYAQNYTNRTKGEVKRVHTNTIEGALAFAKDHLRSMHGSTVENEYHMCLRCFQTIFEVGVSWRVFGTLYAKCTPSKKRANTLTTRPSSRCGR